MSNKGKKLVKYGLFGKERRYERPRTRTGTLAPFIGLSLSATACAFAYLLGPSGVFVRANEQPTIAIVEAPTSEGVATPQKSGQTPAPSLPPEPKSEKQQVIEYIVEVFGEDSADAITMLRKCENSEFSTTAINHNSNGSKDYSPMQINSIHAKRFGNDFMTDWKANIRVAKAIFDEQGWSPWACSKHINVKPYWEN